MEFAIYEIPLIWSTLLSWLKPPYLYFVINAIIITIVASSRFHPKLDGEFSNSEPLNQAKPPPPSDLPLEFAPVQVIERIEAPALDVITPVVVNSIEKVGHEDENEFVISRSTWTPPQRINSPEEYQFPVSDKPLVSSRFSHRKPTKTSPEGGRALRVTKPKRQETLESTWKTITDGRHVPLTRHLKKSDTFENHGCPAASAHDSPSDRNVMQSETFRDRTNYEPAAAVSSSPGSGGGGKLRKEASLSQDELNRRVEAFIKKFNEEMRLQRQESLNQYMEMVNRGTH